VAEIVSTFSTVEKYAAIFLDEKNKKTDYVPVVAWGLCIQEDKEGGVAYRTSVVLPLVQNGSFVRPASDRPEYFGFCPVTDEQYRRLWEVEMPSNLFSRENS
jgi:hypothetical protein